MRKFTLTFIKLLVILTGQLSVAFAQKLPKVQTTSVWAPPNIKIDGKTTEWNDRFQAHNTGNHVFYTLSNDNKNLYLALRMEDLDGDNRYLREV